MAINVGQGTIIEMTISSSLTAIAQVTEISGPSIEVPGIDKTNLADVARRFRAGLPAGGKPAFTIQYDPTNTTHEAMITAISSWPQVALVWNILFNTAATTDKAVFTAFLTKFDPKGMNQDDNLEADVELQIDGLPVFT
jgi:hypothetical protein